MNGLAEGLPFAVVSFVMAQKRAEDILLTVADKFQAPKILEHGNAATAEDFDALLGKRFVAVGEIADGADRTIGETQPTFDVVITVSTGVREAVGLDRERG